MNSNETEINFKAFSKLIEDNTLIVTITEINELLKKQNYANLYLNVIGEQIMELNNKIDKIMEWQKNWQKEINSTKTIVEETRGEIIARPSIQPPPDIVGFNLKPIGNLEKLLDQKFKTLKLNTLNNEGDPQDYEDEFMEEINKIEKFARKPMQTKFYYPRPTPQDVLYEEQEIIDQNSYNGKQIYEWNIDGFTERQIYNTIHRMMMYSTICKGNNNSDKAIVKMIIAGFTGQLKGWWDNYLSQTDKDEILNTVKSENNISEEKAVYTLATNIVEHFTGRWSDNSENIRTLLQNLKCKTLTSFRWYKDVFLSRVMELPESNDSHWKSKFIDGLPHLFAERVRNVLRKGDLHINYNQYTYGKLIGTCIQEGLNLCNEIRLNKQIKRQNLTEKSQLGQFCAQFGMEMKPSDKSKISRNRTSRFKEKRYKRRKFRKEINKEKDLARKNEWKAKNNTTKKIRRCYICGETDHLANRCRNKKARRLKKKINNLNLQEEEKQEILNVIYSEKEESSESEESEEQNELKNIEENFEYSSTTSESEEEEPSCSCRQEDNSHQEFYELMAKFKEM